MQINKPAVFLVGYILCSPHFFWKVSWGFKSGFTGPPSVSIPTNHHSTITQAHVLTNSFPGISISAGLHIHFPPFSFLLVAHWQHWLCFNLRFSLASWFLASFLVRHPHYCQRAPSFYFFPSSKQQIFSSNVIHVLGTVMVLVRRLFLACLFHNVLFIGSFQNTTYSTVF